MSSRDSVICYQPAALQEEERSSTGTAFLLWLACALGICGVHRFYLGKPLTGILYFFTFGLLGIGQVVDLFLLRGMVREANGQRQLVAPRRRRLLPAPKAARADARQLARAELFRAARSAGGHLTVAQAVAATGLSEPQAEKLLDELCVEGHADIDNDPETGAVQYSFIDLPR